MDSKRRAATWKSKRRALVGWVHEKPVALSNYLNIMELETCIANDWFNSYWNSWQQIVTVNNEMSHKCKLTCGVPQGSVLGPLFFNIYHSIIFINLQAYLIFIYLLMIQTYFVNTKIYLLNSELLNIHTWLCANKLSLNIENSHFALCYYQQKKLKNFPFHLYLYVTKN